MWKILTAASTAIALLGAPALADMATWDANADSSIDQSEFETGFGEGGVFGEWDADQDSMLSEDEFSAGYQGDSAFGDFDANADSMLDETEFNAGVFGDYDADDDDAWGAEEYGAYEEDEWF